MCDQAAKFSTALPIRCGAPTPLPLSRGHLASALNSDPTPNAWLPLRQPPQGSKDFDFLRVTSCPLWFNISLAKSLLSNILPVTPFDARICRLSAGSICGKSNRINYMQESISKKIATNPRSFRKGVSQARQNSLFIIPLPSLPFVLGGHEVLQGKHTNAFPSCDFVSFVVICSGVSREFPRQKMPSPKGRKNTRGPHWHSTTKSTNSGRTS